MLRYVAHRLLVMIPTLLAISFIVFVIIQLPPGDYLESYVAELQSRGEGVDFDKVAFLREQYGLDKPFLVQYALWVLGLLRGDLGYSFEFNLPVNAVVGDRLWLTALVSFATIIFTYGLAIPIGIYSAMRQYSLGDYGATIIGYFGMATPSFMDCTPKGMPMIVKQTRNPPTMYDSHVKFAPR